MKRTPLKRTGRRAKSWRKKMWPEFSRLIRARDGRCLMMDAGFGACGGILNASHFYPKGKYPLLMLHPLNSCALCLVHHLYFWHKNPIESWTWYEHTIPQWWRVKLEHARRHSIGRKYITEAEQRDEWRRYKLC